MKNDAAFKFTCVHCHGHTLIVTHSWSVLAGSESERWQEWGPLNEDHHWQYEFKEKVEKNANDDDQRGDFGEYEEDDSSSEPEEYEVNETETNRESDEFFVNCESCDREVEFGWTEPDRRGLILPVEFSDFDSSKSWPDPKYAKHWREKGWAHKRKAQPA